MFELFQMWLLVELLGLLCLPLTLIVFRNLPDRGWAFSKALGMVVLAFCVWFPLMVFHFLPFNQLFIIGIALDLTAISVFYFTRMYATILQVVRQRLSYILVTEFVFLAMVFLLGWLRSYGPEIRSFETFMDEGFIASIMRSPHFPPNDMWLSGYSINYYYYAHYTVAVLAKLLGQSPSIAFNTGICLFFGLCAVNLFGVTCNIVAYARRLRIQAKTTRDGDEKQNALSPSLLPAIPYGFLSMGMALIFGNLAATQQWWKMHDAPTPNLFATWFNPSRVLGPLNTTINEFPAFSFLLSCFHAHVLSLAFTILALALAFNLFLEPQAKGIFVFGRGWHLPLTLLTTAVVLGGLFTMNGWDYPTYMGLTLLCLIFQQWLVHTERLHFTWLLHACLAGGSLLALSFLLYLPFYLHFISPSQGISFVSPNLRSVLSDEWLIYGLFAFAFLSLLLASALKRPLFARQEQNSLFALHSSLATFPSPSLPAEAVPPTTPVTQENHLSVFTSAEGQHHLQPLMSPLASETVAATADSAPAEAELPAFQHPLTAVAVASPLPAVPAPPAPSPLRTFSRLLSLLCIISYLLFCFAILKVVPNSATFVVGSSFAVLGALLMLYHFRERALSFTLLLGATAFALVALCEIFYLRDVFADSNYERMNTVFKFYFQAWVLLSVACGAGSFFVLERLRAFHVQRPGWRWLSYAPLVAWSLLGLAFVSASMVYPLTAPFARYARTDAAHPYLARTNSLDGLDYLQREDPADYAAIRWLNTNVEGDPVIVEAMGNDYSTFDRISTFTGLPTLIGWVGHEYQWRVMWLKNPSNNADYQRRGFDLDQIYTNSDSAVVLSLLARYHVQYLYVGSLETSKYPQANLHRFSAFMQIVYNSNGVTIYKVR